MEEIPQFRDVFFLNPNLLAIFRFGISRKIQALLSFDCDMMEKSLSSCWDILESWRAEWDKLPNPSHCIAGFCHQK